MSKNTETLGLPFFEGSKAKARQRIIDLAQKKSGASVIFANAHVVVEAAQNKSLKEILLKSTLIVPDGVPIAWVMKAKGLNLAERYSGPDLMEDLFRETKKLRHFFLGSSQSVLDKIQNKFTGMAAGFYSPPFVNGAFSESEIQNQLTLIEKAQPDFIWVGLGAPKQEKYVVEMASRYPKAVWLAVGAAFDFYAGNKPRAPKNLQKWGLEWAYRMFTEPRRLAIRYVKTNPVFARMAVGEMARGLYRRSLNNRRKPHDL